MKSPARIHVPERGAKRPVCSRVEATYQRLKRDIMEGVYTPRQRLIEQILRTTHDDRHLRIDLSNDALSNLHRFG